MQYLLDLIDEVKEQLDREGRHEDVSGTNPL